MSEWWRTGLWLTSGGERSAHAGIAISTLFHLCVVAALGYWLIGGGSAAPPILLTTEWADDPATPLPFDQEPASAEELESESGGSSLGEMAFVPSVTTTAPHVVMEAPLVPLESAAMSFADVDLTAPVQPLSGTGRNAALGTGDGDGDETGDGSGTGFFGLNAPGESFVFVVDASGSMRRPFPGAGTTLLGRVKLELIQCITQMSPDQQFFIVFFNNDAIPMPSDRLMEATPEAQRRYLYWMGEVKARGMTEPETALSLALRLNPDVVYFLTDGDFKYRVIDHVKENNRRGTTIHTVGFGDRSEYGERAERFMRMIAEQNGGTYQFVSSEEAAAQLEGTAGDQISAGADVDSTSR